MAKRGPKVRNVDPHRDAVDVFLSKVGVTPHLCNQPDCTTMARYRWARRELDGLIRRDGRTRRGRA